MNIREEKIYLSLLHKANLADKKGNWIDSAKYQKKANEYKQQCENADKGQLLDFVKDKKHIQKLSEYITKATIFADLAYDSILELDEILKANNIVKLQLAEDIHQMNSLAHKIVGHIDARGDIKLSEHYAEMVTKVEETIYPYLKRKVNAIYKEYMEMPYSEMVKKYNNEKK